MARVFSASDQHAQDQCTVEEICSCLGSPLEPHTAGLAAALPARRLVQRPPSWSRPMLGDDGTSARPTAGPWRNLGDDLANRPLQHSPTPTSTNTVSRRYSERRRPDAKPDLVDTEEVTGSIPVSPTTVCAAQRLVTRSWVTSQLRCVPYTGSKMGAHDHLPDSVPA